MDKNKPVPYDFSPDDEVETVMDAFKILFGDEVCYIKTRDVKVGGTSGLVYVPKSLQGKRVTVVVWLDKDRYYQGDGIVTDSKGVPVE